MIWMLIIATALLHENCILGFELNSLPGRTVCYRNKQLNCNEDFTDAYPHLSMSATNVTKANTFFLLFTRKNPDTPEMLHKCAGKLPPDTNFNPDNELIVILTPFIVGFCDIAAYREWLYEMLKRGDYNVLAVDYNWGKHIDYATAALDVRIVADQCVIVLKNIQEETGITKDKITLVGHSLGAQLAGLIGGKFRVKRISALDPAGYAFDKNPTKYRLDPSDADFVDVWHCNAGKCLPNLGTIYDVGHVNFYINGGIVQPGCYKYSLISLAKRDFIYGIGTALNPTLCFHAHCAQYYRASINPENCQFVGVRCKSYLDFKSGRCRRCGKNGERCMIMGFDTDKFLNGNISSPRKYYLDTTNTCPYCDNSYIRLEGFSSTYKSSLQKTKED